MSWTAPQTWVAGTVVTASDMNTHVRDNLRYLKGLDGVPTIESGLTIDNSDGDERLLLPLLTTGEVATTLNAEGEVAWDETTNQMKAYDGTAVRIVLSEADVDDTPVNGATTVPVSSNWAYDFQQALTTAGDVPYATAAGVWDRLGIGTALQVLRTNAGATAPEWSTPPATLTVAETEVYNAAAPTAYTDLDLSAVVGSNAALVLLKFKGDDTDISFAIRKNGDTDDFEPVSTSLAGVAAGRPRAFFVALWVPTDSSGVIEWIADVADTATVDVMAYIK